MDVLIVGAETRTMTTTTPVEELSDLAGNSSETA